MRSLRSGFDTDQSDFHQSIRLPRSGPSPSPDGARYHGVVASGVSPLLLCGGGSAAREPVPLSWLAREQYRTADGISFPAELAKNFYRRHLIAAEMGRTGEAYAAVLHAAWVCDDEGDCENAVRCRKLALTFLDDAIEKSGPNEDMIIIRADLLRRSGQFDKLIREYSDRTFSKAILNDIVAFQLKRAAEKDTQCYTIAQACDKPDETT